MCNRPEILPQRLERIEFAPGTVQLPEAGSAFRAASIGAASLGAIGVRPRFGRATDGAAAY
jgi:hypothetical protein